MSKAKSILTAFCVAVIMCAASINVFAAGTVTYDGSSRKFIFESGSEHSPTDLFNTFKGVMPGDSITEDIVIKNNVKNGVKIKLYIKAGGAHTDSEDFLSKLQLTVSKDSKQELFKAPANQTAGLTEWTELGTFYSGADVKLRVTLEVPLELDNNYQQAIGQLDWHFKVDELPIEPNDPKPPKTGDTTKASLFVVLAAVSTMGIILLIALKRRRREIQ